MRPCQQCDGDYAIGMWMSALLLFTLMLVWKYWPRLGRAGRFGACIACIAVLAALTLTSYWLDKTDSTGRTCGNCAMPAIASPAPGSATRPAAVTTTVASRPSGDRPLPATSPEVVAFYFHRTIRCHSCLQIEEWARQAIENRFADDLANGLLGWRAVNIDQPENKHFEKDYALTAQSLILVRMNDGRPGEWKNLESVWELLGDYARFTEYVQTEVSSFFRAPAGT